MPQLDVDAMNDATRWSAFAPDGLTPSTALVMADETATVRYGADARSARIDGSTAAAGHLLRRNLPALDLSAHDELRLWINGTRLADGTTAQPFFLELKLGSAALGLTAPGNTWQRLFPVQQRATWEPIRLSLSDLPASIRSAVTQLQLRCVDASAAFSCYLDDLIAVRDEMIADVEGALKGRLHNVLSVGSQPIPALVHSAGVTETATPPWLLITQYDVLYADARTSSALERGDFTGAGYSLRPPSTAWDLIYQVEVSAGDRPTQVALLGLVLQALGPRGALVVNGAPLPYELVTVPALERTGGARGDRVLFFYRVLARQLASAAPAPVIPVRGINLVTPG